jgi:formylglycine-generating enzyme required for sulfatase activity
MASAGEMDLPLSFLRAPEVTVKICPHCATSLPDDAISCLKCGARQDGTDVASVTAHNSGSGSLAQGDRTLAIGQSGVVMSGDAIQSSIVTGDHNVVNVTYQGATFRIPSPEAVQQHRAVLRRKLETEAQQRWGGMGVYIGEDSMPLPIEASPYQPGLTGPREDLIQRLHNADRLIVLGEPGSGKTVALQRFAWELCGKSDTLIPVAIPLLFYAGTSLDEWVRSVLQETSCLRIDDGQALVAFLRDGQARCVFLFDGLNEVAPTHRDRLKDELVRWLFTYPRHPIIMTTRVQDELWQTLRQTTSKVVVIQPITDLQVVEYFKTGLGNERGQALFDNLDTRLRALAQRPLLLWLMKESAFAGESLPGNRGELYRRFVSRMLKRDAEREMHAKIPDRVKRQVAAHLAETLQRRHTLACQYDEVLEIVAHFKQYGAPLASQAVEALARHGLLIGDEHVRFPHQTLQEYFAAEALREHAQHEAGTKGLRRVERTFLSAITRKPEGFVALSADEWWAESFIQLAGLIDDSAGLVRSIAGINPWLAWWCVEEGQAVDQSTRNLIESGSISLLKSSRIEDRRRALQVLAQMRGERVVDILLQSATDPNAEIAGLTLQILLNMGKDVREYALVTAQRTTSPAQEGSLVYLSTLLGQEVVFVPPGPFEMGSQRTVGKSSEKVEQPAHQVSLGGYWIGRYPVTTAQFRTFLEASQHVPSNSDLSKADDNHPVVSVSWHDAMAYCCWLSDRTDLHVTLPSEAEWEKAARGTDGRIYPWGDEQPDNTLCNFNRVDVMKGTVPVGHYSPRGDSPYRCADMAGNVWEWTRSIFKEYPYDSRDGREDANGQGTRVLRGGSYNNNSRFVRCAARRKSMPETRSTDAGFRLVVCPS